jgi:hypothetical protein
LGFPVVIAGWVGFKQYVWSALLSYNLLVLARIQLAFFLEKCSALF